MIIIYTADLNSDINQFVLLYTITRLLIRPFSDLFKFDSRRLFASLLTRKQGPLQSSLRLPPAHLSTNTVETSQCLFIS